MAKEEEVTQEAAPPKKKKLLIIIIVAVLVIAIAGGATLLLLGGKKKHGKNEEEVDSAEKGHNAPITIAIEEKFTVNLMTEDGSNHFLQIPKLELEVADAASAKEVEEKKSKISDRISSTLRSKTMKELQQPGSDIKLKEELRVAVNSVLELKGTGKGVKEVILPASFLIQ
jgi:flagellar FliL protein